MSLLFKKATEKDIPIIARLADHIWRKHYLPIIGPIQVDYMIRKMYSPESILQQMNDQQQYSLVYDHETPIGYLCVSSQDNKHYFLHKLYVEMGKRNKGVGSQMLNYILDTYNTAESMELTVNRQNYNAINFYFKNGFVIKEVADFDIGEGFFMNDFIMTASCDHIRQNLHSGSNTITK